MPQWLNPALDRLPDGTAVQATDVMGGYLMWRHPELDLQGLRRGWDKTLRASRVRYALLPTKSRLAYALPRFEKWRVLHTSRDVTMFEAPEGWDR